MKIRPSRIPAYLLLIFTALSPSMLVNQAMAQDSNLFVAAWSNLGPTFFIVFLLLIIAGITLIIFNSIAVRRKAFIKDDVLNPIMDAVKGLDIEEPSLFVINTNYRLLPYLKVVLKEFRMMNSISRQLKRDWMKMPLCTCLVHLPGLTCLIQLGRLPQWLVCLVLLLV